MKGKWATRSGDVSEIRRLFTVTEGGTTLTLPHVETIQVSCGCGSPHEETKKLIEGALEADCARLNAGPSGRKSVG